MWKFFEETRKTKITKNNKVHENFRKKLQKKLKTKMLKSDKKKQKLQKNENEKKWKYK